jgi:hypothetical protein
VEDTSTGADCSQSMQLRPMGVHSCSLVVAGSPGAGRMFRFMPITLTEGECHPWTPARRRMQKEEGRIFGVTCTLIPRLELRNQPGASASNSLAERGRRHWTPERAVQRQFLLHGTDEDAQAVHSHLVLVPRPFAFVLASSSPSNHAMAGCQRNGLGSGVFGGSVSNVSSKGSAPGYSTAAVASARTSRS